MLLSNLELTAGIQLEGEPEKAFKHILEFDSNNSMKWMYQMGEYMVTNMKPFTDTFYLLPVYVDKFKDEVSSGWGPVVIEREDGQAGDEGNWEDVNDYSPEEKLIVGCTQNWKAASQDGKLS